MDWEDWRLFLTLLSLEQTQTFSAELGLPLRPAQFPEAVRLARACLEAEMFPPTLTPDGHAGSPGFIEAWRAWRAAGGVLDEGRLRAVHERLGRRWDDYLPYVFGRLRGWVGAGTADALRAWFRRHRSPHDHRRYTWVWLLRDFVLGGRAPEPAPLAPAERGAVEEFYRSCQRGRRELELRFWRLREEARAAPPSLWEAVLLTFGADGPLTDRYWLGDIEACLALRDLRRAWGGLRRELGAERLAELTAWVRRCALALPGGGEFPEGEPDEEEACEAGAEGRPAGAPPQ